MDARAIPLLKLYETRAIHLTRSDSASKAFLMSSFRCTSSEVVSSALSARAF